jgi:hypothetical protein
MTTRTYRASASEHQEQCALIEWCRTFAGQHPDLAYIVAVPNGGARPLLVGVALKAEGVSPGYPDLLLDVARGEYHGWRGELKKVGGYVAPAQAAWHTRLRAQGYAVDVAYGWTNMAAALCRYLGIDHERMGL